MMIGSIIGFLWIEQTDVTFLKIFFTGLFGRRRRVRPAMVGEQHVSRPKLTPIPADAECVCPGCSGRGWVLHYVALPLSRMPMRHGVEPPHEYLTERRHCPTCKGHRAIPAQQAHRDVVRRAVLLVTKP